MLLVSEGVDYSLRYLTGPPTCGGPEGLGEATHHEGADGLGEAKHHEGDVVLGRGSVGEVVVDAGVVVPADDDVPARCHPQVGEWDIILGGSRDFGLEPNLLAMRWC